MAPVFASSLSKTNINDIEQVQKIAFRIILRGEYNNYENALAKLGEKSLEERRLMISLKFAKKCVKHPRMKHLFKTKNKVSPRGGNIYLETKLKDNRGYNEPINYFTRLLNNQTSTKYQF